MGCSLPLGRRCNGVVDVLAEVALPGAVGSGETMPSIASECRVVAMRVRRYNAVG